MISVKSYCTVSITCPTNYSLWPLQVRAVCLLRNIHQVAPLPSVYKQCNLYDILLFTVYTITHETYLMPLISLHEY